MEAAENQNCGVSWFPILKQGFCGQQMSLKGATRSGGSFGLLWFQLAVNPTNFSSPACCHRRRGVNRISVFKSQSAGDGFA